MTGQHAIIDTHAHYDHRRFADDRDALLSGLPGRGVARALNVGSDIKSSEASVKLAAEYPHVYASVGVHPHCAGVFADESNLERLRALAASPKVAAYGEIGLDFHRNFSEPRMQRVWFEKQLALACELGLPVIVHSREAAEEVFGIIARSGARRGVIHSFSGDAALALRYVALGFHIGVGGVATFKNAGALREVCAEVPLDKILLETDCPYLAPHPHRGGRNDSTLLPLVAEAVAAARGVSAEEVRRATTANAARLFGLGLAGEAAPGAI